MILRPLKIIDQLGNLEEKIIADIGAGVGFFTYALAHRAGERGKVYAIDIQHDLISKVKRGAAESGLNNVEIIWGNAERLGGTKLADDHVDIALVSNVIFQFENKEDAFFELRRIVKPGGKIVVIDWRDSFGGMGPHPRSVVSEERARELMKRSGFNIVEILDTGNYHYGMIGEAKRA
jgi:ubiquinone/menaquinone biosynthesis C-methylase UbiE